MLRHLGAGLSARERARLGVAFLAAGRKAAEAMLENHWLAADSLAARLGLPPPVSACLNRWPGRYAGPASCTTSVAWASRTPSGTSLAS